MKILKWLTVIVFVVVFFGIIFVVFSNGLGTPLGRYLLNAGLFGLGLLAIVNIFGGVLFLNHALDHDVSRAKPALILSLIYGLVMLNIVLIGFAILNTILSSQLMNYGWDDIAAEDYMFAE